MSRVVCDESRCSGCLACITACMDEHYSETETDAVSPRLYRKITCKSGLMRYTTDNCQHCEHAPCIEACSANVLIRTDNGFVVASGRENCLGCGACRAACPHDAIRFDSQNRIVKCDGCYKRVEKGLLPACVRTCPSEALMLEI